MQQTQYTRQTLRRTVTHRPHQTTWTHREITFPWDISLEAVQTQVPCWARRPVSGYEKQDVQDNCAFCPPPPLQRVPSPGTRATPTLPGLAKRRHLSESGSALCRQYSALGFAAHSRRWRRNSRWHSHRNHTLASTATARTYLSPRTSRMHSGRSSSWGGREGGEGEEGGGQKRRRDPSAVTATSCRDCVFFEERSMRVKSGLQLTPKSIGALGKKIKANVKVQWPLQACPLPPPCPTSVARYWNSTLTAGGDGETKVPVCVPHFLTLTHSSSLSLCVGV